MRTNYGTSKGVPTWYWNVVTNKLIVFVAHKPPHRSVQETTGTSNTGEHTTDRPRVMVLYMVDVITRLFFQGSLQRSCLSHDPIKS